MAARELFRSQEAQLYIREGEESVLMQSGDFALVLVKNAVSQLAAVVAMVGAVQWPVGRDFAVTRTGEASFSFSLPGPLSYTLVLRSTSSAADLQSLETLLEDYSTCSSPQRPAAVAGGGVQEGSHKAEKQVENCSVDLSLEMVGKMQRARRMSAIAKVFYKSLERGAINVANHVKPMAMDKMASTQVSDRSSSVNLALAGVDAVAKVVEAVEMGGRTLLESAVSAVAAASEAGSHDDGVSGLICSGWTLNNHGLLMLYRVITASMAIHSGLSSRSGSSRSGSSSSSEFRRLLSSSPSSSSFSSKSPSHVHVQAGGADDASRGADTTSVAALTPAHVAGTASLSPHDPPALPLFTSCAGPRAARIMSEMPPPSGPLPLDSSLFRIYKPRPTPPTPSSSSTPPPPAPPPFLPRPPRFQPPQK